jgi:hypothetical protein
MSMTHLSEPEVNSQELKIDEWRNSEMNRLKFSGVVTTLTVSTALFFVPSTALADARSQCQHRVEKAREHYRVEPIKHGRDSRQAQDARTRLTNEWDRCYSEVHAWYDPNRHEWHKERDWDRNYDWDHDRDRDHH